MDMTKVKLNLMNNARQYDLPDEPKRRLAAVQGMMKEMGIRVLLIEKGVDGNDRWLNDTLAMGLPSVGLTIVPDEGQQLVINGYTVIPEGPAQRLTGMQWSQTSATVVNGLSAVDLREMLGNTNQIGIIYPQQMRASVYDYLMEQLPKVELVDVTTAFSAVKAVKSVQELEVYTQVAKQDDIVFGAVPSMVRVGLYEKDVVGELRRTAYKTGTGGFSVFTQAMVELISSPMDQPRSTKPLYYPGRELQVGDVVSVKAHITGMNGYYGCLGRCYVLGNASENAKLQWSVAVNAQHLAAVNMKTGATLDDVRQKVKAYIISQGYTPDFSSSIYGLGYWMSEDPMLGNASAHVALQPGMVFAVAPGVCITGQEHPFCMSCADTYVVTDSGAQRLNHLPQSLQCV